MEILNFHNHYIVDTTLHVEYPFSGLTNVSFVNSTLRRSDGLFAFRGLPNASISMNISNNEFKYEPEKY